MSGMESEAALVTSGNAIPADTAEDVTGLPSAEQETIEERYEIPDPDERRPAAPPGPAAGREAPAEEPPAVEGVEEDPFTAELLADAGRIGLLADQARAFPNPESLQAAVDTFHRKVLDGAETLATAERPYVATEPGAPPPAAPPPTAKPAVAEPGALDLDLDELSEEEYQAPLVKMNKALRTVQERVNPVLKQYGELMGQLRGVQQALQMAYEDRFDTRVAAMGPEYAEVLGTGPTADLPPNSAGRQKRQQIDAAMWTLAAQYARMQSSVPSEGKLQELAARAVLGDAGKQIEEQRVSAGLENRSRQALSPASRGRKRPEPAGDEAAEDFVKGYFEKRGVPTVEHEKIEDGI